MKIAMYSNVINLLLLLISVIGVHSAEGFGSDRILLKDVQVLTLKQGHMTNGRRSSPVPQLSCVGGSAKSLFNPSVVQCYNRGFDGYDVQWECKADMDNAYRFGQVGVTCEGYDYPDDPYILKGSCGLEYTLELTEEGYQKKQNTGYHHSSGYSDHHGSYSSSQYGKKASSVFGDLVALAIVALIVYGIYRTCVASPRADNSTDETHRTQDWGSRPPPPGFRSDYMPGSDKYSGSGTYSSSSRSNTNSDTGGGFWTGAATGGLLGYLFGSRGSRTYNTYQPGYQPNNSWWGTPSSGWSSGWGGSSGWGASHRSTSFGGSSGGFSSGTRTASGFGGTKRR